MVRILPLFLAGGSLCLAACADGSDLSAPVDTMIEFEVAWQCDVTRYSFADSQAIDDKQDEFLTRFGIDEADHASFAVMLSDDPELRETVADMIDGRCPAETDEAEAQ